MVSITELICEESIVVNGFETCVLGVSSKQQVVYDQEAMIRVLIERDGMSESEAIEFFDYNIDGAYVGDYTPIYLTLLGETT